MYHAKYIKYKSKYLDLQEKMKNIQIGGNHECLMCGNETCLKLIDCLTLKINSITDDNIVITTIEGSSDKETELIIIPGFSTDSYNRNYNTLFTYYDTKLDITKFRRTHIIRFRDDTTFSFRNFHMSFFREGQIIDSSLENQLYRKCAEIISNKLNHDINYTVIAKSAGGGVGIYLTQFLTINNLFLFAPGAEYINNDESLDKNKFQNVIIGWNKEDTKVPYAKIWNDKLSTVFPEIQVLLDNKDTQDSVDTQHEINTTFIKLINE